MAAKKAEGILFSVEYEDGRTARMTIDRHTLRNGDHVARIIAGERQRAGKIPEGKIKGVRRVVGQ